MSTIEDTHRMALDMYLQELAIEADACGSYTFEQQQSIQEIHGRVEILIIQFLSNCVPRERFKIQEFANLITQNSLMDSFEFIKAAHAFKNLEHYIILLCIMPWKQEFRRIKKFNGFYQTKIESHLKNADTIFKLVGYSETTSGILTLTRGVDTSALQYVAFECLVASQECHMLERVWSKIHHLGLPASKVVQIWLKTKGTEDELVKLVERQYGKHEKSNAKLAENVVDCQVPLNSYNRKPSTAVSTAPFWSKLENHLQTAKKLGTDPGDDIPFIDEGVKDSNYVPMDQDEQIMASLKMVEGKDIKRTGNNGNMVPNMKPSQEWSFVREGLEKNYGKQYFEGIRKDFLENPLPERHQERKETPYVKVYAQDPDPGYVNSEEANKLKKMEANAIHHLGEPSYTTAAFNDWKDSAYASTYTSAVGVQSNSALYPPTVESFDQMRKRGNIPQGQVTDTVITKGTNNLVGYTGGLAKTEPIRKRSAPVESSGQKLYHTQPYYPSSGKNDYHSPDLENIQKYSKRASAPPLVRTGDQYNIVGMKCTSSSGSYNEMTPQNMPDSAQVNYYVHNIPVQSNGTEAGWSCIYCTYLNNPLTDICEMCSKSRDSHTDVDSPPIAGHSSRICEQCTLENEKNSVTCNACGHQLKGLQTVI